MQDEIKRNTGYGVTSIVYEEEVCVLIGKGNNSKGMKVQVEVESIQNHGKNKHHNKIKCFHCHEFRNYATKCLHGESSKNLTSAIGGMLLHHISS